MGGWRGSIPRHGPAAALNVVCRNRGIFNEGSGAEGES